MDEDEPEQNFVKVQEPATTASAVGGREAQQENERGFSPVLTLPRPEKKRRRNWDVGEQNTQQMKRAVKEAQSGSRSLRGVAAKYGVPETSLRRRIQPGYSKGARGRPPTNATPTISTLIRASRVVESQKRAADSNDDGRSQKMRTNKPPTYTPIHSNTGTSTRDAVVKLLECFPTSSRIYDRELASMPYSTPLQKMIRDDEARDKKVETYCTTNNRRRIECNEKNCWAGGKCTNRRSRYPYLASCVAVLQAGMGTGLKVMEGEHIPEGAFVGQYTGEVSTRPTEKEVRELVRTNAYIAEINVRPDYGDRYGNTRGKFLVDAKKQGNLTRFINHSCDANCEMETWIVGMEAQLWFVAKRDIRGGEFVTFSYGEEANQFFPDNVCLCGAATCGWSRQKKS